MSSPGRDRRVNIPNRREKETSSPTSWKAPAYGRPQPAPKQEPRQPRALASLVSPERTVDEDGSSAHAPQGCPRTTRFGPPHGPGWSNMTLGRTCLSS